MSRPNAGGFRALPETPNILAAADLDDATEEQRRALRAAFLAVITDWRTNVDLLVDAAAGPDPEMTAVYLLDTLAALPGELRVLDAAVRRALAHRPSVVPSIAA